MGHNFVARLSHTLNPSYTRRRCVMQQKFTGVDESASRKPGIAKQTIQLSYGVYKTVDAKLELRHTGFDDALPCAAPLKVTITLPQKWHDEPTPVRVLKQHFLAAYRRKHPNAPLALAADDAVSLAVKDESMFLFSKRRVADDDIVTRVFYDKQVVWAMGDADWRDLDAELNKLREAVADGVLYTMRHVRHPPEALVPLTSRKQLKPLEQAYLLLAGWYKQQCVVVQPDFTVADVKAYLHHKNGARMPIESLDLGLRVEEGIHVVDDALTLQEVYVTWMSMAAKAAAGGEGSDGDGGDSDSGVDDDDDEGDGLVVPDWDDAPAPAASGAPAAAVDGAEAEIVLDTSSAGAPPAAGRVQRAPPSFLGQTLVLGVGKRVQDRKHKIFVPSVHDPYSFKTPADQHVDNTGDTLLLPAPKGFQAGAEPVVNDDEKCSVM